MLVSDDAQCQAVVAVAALLLVSCGMSHHQLVSDRILQEPSSWVSMDMCNGYNLKCLTLVQ